MKFKIYKLISPSNHCYVGQTKQNSIETRLLQHINEWKRWIKKDRPRKTYQAVLYYAFDKYDPNTWKLELLEECDTQDQANQLEIKYIEEMGYYNTQKGGQGWSQLNLNDQHKENISKSRKEYFQSEEGSQWKEILSQKLKTNNPSKKGNVPWNKGIPQTEETKKKISSGVKKTFKETPEIMLKKSEKLKESWARGDFKDRPKPTTETIQKQIQSRIGFKQTEYQKQRASETKSKTWKITSPDGKTQVIKSLRNFCKDKNVDSSTLSSRGHSKGWKVEKIDDATIHIHQERDYKK